MSKVLKVIVNLFLICAILIAGALLIPPLAGISTTMVDSNYMTSNLSVGSVTYSQKVGIADLAVNDKVLVETDSEIHAYAVEAADAGVGSCIVADVNDPQAGTIELKSREVSKILITIPMIGYVMIAMGSLEGLIIIGLVVLFVIILFILSELWKKTGDEDDEYDDEDEDRDYDLSESQEIEMAGSGQSSAYVEPTTELTVEEIAHSVAELKQEEVGVSAEDEPEPEEKDVVLEKCEPEESQQEDKGNASDDGGFVPVVRPTKEEILRKASEAGEEPTVITYENYGVTIIDYTDCL